MRTKSSCAYATPLVLLTDGENWEILIAAILRRGDCLLILSILLSASEKSKTLFVEEVGYSITDWYAADHLLAGSSFNGLVTVHVKEMRVLKNQAFRYQACWKLQHLEIISILLLSKTLRYVNIWLLVTSRHWFWRPMSSHSNSLYQLKKALDGEVEQHRRYVFAAAAKRLSKLLRMLHVALILQ